MTESAVPDSSQNDLAAILRDVAPSRLFGLHGRVALVTGAAGGIGQTLAAGLGTAGADLALTDRSDAGLESVARTLEEGGIRCLPVVADLRDDAAPARIIDAVMEEYGQLDVLINCAAINQRVALLDVDGEIYDRLMQVDLRAPFFLAQAAARVMSARATGAIVNLSSVNAQVGFETNGVYGPAKGALSQLTKVMAIEWGHLGIRTNALAPGFIDTPLTRALQEDPRRSRWLLARTPAGRLGQPRELVGTCLLLASDAGSFINGQTFFVDGGMLAGSRWDA